MYIKKIKINYFDRKNYIYNDYLLHVCLLGHLFWIIHYWSINIWNSLSLKDWMWTNCWIFKLSEGTEMSASAPMVINAPPCRRLLRARNARCGQSRRSCYSVCSCSRDLRENIREFARQNHCTCVRLTTFDDEDDIACNSWCVCMASIVESTIRSAGKRWHARTVAAHNKRIAADSAEPLWVSVLFLSLSVSLFLRIVSGDCSP